MVAKLLCENLKTIRMCTSLEKFPTDYSLIAKGTMVILQWRTLGLLPYPSKANITSNGASWYPMLPDMKHWEGHSATHCAKMCNLVLIRRKYQTNPSWWTLHKSQCHERWWKDCFRLKETKQTAKCNAWFWIEPKTGESATKNNLI